MFTLARLELRRFLRARLTRAAMVVLMLVPLLYGALYLWAFWDPYGQLNKIPVAIVNEDRPATVDGQPKRIGAELEKTLLDKNTFAWKVTDAKDAAKGLTDGTYYLTLTIPADFTAHLVSPSDPSRAPSRGELRLVTNDSTNYLSGALARSAFSEIRSASTAKATKDYFDKMFVSLDQVKVSTAKAADAAGKIDAGSGTLADRSGKLGAGAGRLDSGLGTARDASGKLGAGADQVADGLDTAKTKSKQLSDGLATINAGMGQLDDGAAKTAAGTRALATKLGGAADAVEPFLREHGTDIATAATAVATGADAVLANIDALPTLVTTAVSTAEKARADLVLLGEANPDLKTSPVYVAALDSATKAVAAVHAVQERLALDPASMATLKAQMAQVSATAKKLAAEAPHLGEDVARARTDVNTLASAAEKVSAGVTASHTAVGQAATGSQQLTDGLYRLSTGSRQLDAGLTSLTGGLGDLHDGAGTVSGKLGELSAGLGALHSGADQLAAGLTDGAGRLPGYDTDARAQRSDVMGDPVALTKDTRNLAKTYGVGFAPYFMALALWVGAMIAYMLLRPINARHLASGAPAWRIAFAGWLPGFAVGLVQAGVLLAVLRLALGLSPVHPWALLGLLAVTVAAFTALIQLVGAKLGAAGRLIALALLMLQLVSSAGTYPIETSPAFLRFMHPLLPMTYVVRGLRHLISGGSAGPVWQAVGVLAGFTAAAVGLTTLVVRRSRRLTPSKLHPDLSM